MAAVAPYRPTYPRVDDIRVQLPADVADTGRPRLECLLTRSEDVTPNDNPHYVSANFRSQLIDRLGVEIKKRNVPLVVLFPANRDLTFFTKHNVKEVTYVTTTQSYGSKDQTRQQMFMTSYDKLQVKPTLVNINEAETLLAWLQNYCSGRPQVILYLGDIYLIHEMTVTAFIEDLAFLPQLEVWWRGHLSCGEFGPFSSTGYYYLDKSELHTVPHLNAQTEDIYVHPAPFQAMQRTGLIHDSYLGAMVYFCAKQYESLPAYLERKTLMCGWLGTDWICYRDWETDRKSTRLNSSHSGESRMPSSA